MIAAAANRAGGGSKYNSHSGVSRNRRASKADSHIAQIRRNGSMRMSLQTNDSAVSRAGEENRHLTALSHEKSSSMVESSFAENQIDERSRHEQMEGSMPWLTISVNSRFRQFWDLTSLCAVLYCTFVVPFQMTFDPPQTEVLSGLDMAIEVFFICEIFLNFFTSYVNGDGDEVRSKHLIAWQYLKTWFPIDAVSSIPTESITRIAAKVAEDAGDESGGTDVSALYNLRIIRIVRLTKLLRLLRLGKLIEVIEFSFPSLGTIIGLLRLLFMMVIVAHLQACVFYYLASLNKGNSWISKYHFNCCDENLNLYRAYELKFTPECYDESLLPPLEVLYTNAIYWSFATLTTVGYGDITPCNEMEILFSIASMVIGSAMFAYIVGNISSVVTNMKGQEIKLRQRMRELQEYIALRKIPKHMADVLRRQCMHRWKRTVFDEERVLEEFTPQMRRQVVNFISEDGLPRVPCFQALIRSDLYGDFTTELAIRLKPSSAQQGEDITKQGELGGDLYIVQSGHVELKDRNGNRTYIHDNGCFNELELLHEFLRGDPIEYRHTAKAQSSCELLILRRQDFQEVWEDVVGSSDAEENAHPIKRILLDAMGLGDQQGSQSPDNLEEDGIEPQAEIEMVPGRPGMPGVRRYKTDALALEIPQDDASGVGAMSGSQRRNSTVTETTSASREPSFKAKGAFLPPESPVKHTESSKHLSGGPEEELMEMVDQIGRFVQAQSSMLQRYMREAGIPDDAPMSATAPATLNGSSDWRKSRSLRESSSPGPKQSLGGRPMSTH